MNWIFIALLAPLLFAISSFIDKVLISKYFRGESGALIIYGCLVGLPLALLIFIFNPAVIHITLATAIFVMINGSLLAIYLFPYLKALNQEDASAISPLFQIIPLFTYILSFFILGERLTSIQLIAGAIIILGAMGLSSNFHKGKFHVKKETVFLMLLATLIIAVNSVMFKVFAIELDFWTTTFWQYFGFVIFGILLLFIKRHRKAFVFTFKKNKISILGLNMLNEVVNLAGLLILSYATLLAPIALVGIVNEVYPIIVLILGAIATLVIPKWIKEDLSKETIIRKIIFILIISVGAYILQSTLG